MEESRLNMAGRQKPTMRGEGEGRVKEERLTNRGSPGQETKPPRDQHSQNVSYRRLGTGNRSSGTGREGFRVRAG